MLKCMCKRVCVKHCKVSYGISFSILDSSLDPFIQSSWALPLQFSSVAQSCLTLCDHMNHSAPGLPASPAL